MTVAGRGVLEMRGSDSGCVNFGARDRKEAPPFRRGGGLLHTFRSESPIEGFTLVQNDFGAEIANRRALPR